MRFLRRRRAMFTSIEAPLYVANAAYARLLLEQGGVDVPPQLDGDAGEEFARWYFRAGGRAADDFFGAARAEPEDLEAALARRLAARFRAWLDEPAEAST